MDKEGPAPSLPGYAHVKVLGSGNFGVAHLYKCLASGEDVAVKLIERGPKVDDNVLKEVTNLMTLNHPNVIGFHEVVLTETHLCIVMEYAKHGEVFDLVVRKGRLSEQEARDVFHQLIAGIQYIHNNNICHRDIKLENMLCDEEYVVKVCDFGYSFACDTEIPRGAVGTPAYIAPEMIRTPNLYNGFKADMWSCGVVLYVMLYGCYPFEERDDPRNMRKTFNNIINCRYTMPSDIHISVECKNLIASLLNPDPLRRYTIEKVMTHPWFTQDFEWNQRRVNLVSRKTSQKLMRVPRSRRQTHEEVFHIVKRASLKNLMTVMSTDSNDSTTIMIPDTPPIRKIPAHPAMLQSSLHLQTLS